MIPKSSNIYSIILVYICMLEALIPSRFSLSLGDYNASNCEIPKFCWGVLTQAERGLHQASAQALRTVPYGASRLWEQDSHGDKQELHGPERPVKCLPSQIKKQVLWFNPFLIALILATCIMLFTTSTPTISSAFPCSARKSVIGSNLVFNIFRKSGAKNGIWTPMI